MTEPKMAAAGLAIALILTGASTAAAQTVATTLLHLSASSSVQTAPDQLIMDMVAQSISSSAAEAQRHVNALMADGMQAVKGVSGIDARAIGYSVAPTDDKHMTWTARQTLELHSTDGPAALDLVARLQAKGFTAAALDWRISSALRQKAHDEAITAALKTLQRQAASAAATLGLHIDHLQDVRLDGPVFQPRLPIQMQAMSIRATPPPQATAAPEEVTAEVSADVVLRP